MPDVSPLPGLQRAPQPRKGGSGEGLGSGSVAGGRSGERGGWLAPAGTWCGPGPAGCSETLGRTLAQSHWVWDGPYDLPASGTRRPEAEGPAPRAEWRRGLCVTPHPGGPGVSLSGAAVAPGLAQRPCSHIPLPQASEPGGPRLVGWRRLVFVREYLSPHPQYCQVTESQAPNGEDMKCLP